jgi:hypoxia up-regulated 1
MALNDANVTIEQLGSVILHGGSVRVPFVQKAIEDKVGSNKVAKTVNADEAAVMGAIFRGAQLNNQFRVKDIRSKDRSIYDIEIATNATVASKDAPTVLFPHHTKLGYTKTLAFKTSEDVHFTISYSSDADLPNDISRILLDGHISGVADKIEKLKGTNECHDPTVKVSLKLTDGGLVEVLHSEIQCEIREKKNLADKFKGIFGGGGKDKEDKEDQIVFEKPEASTSGTPASESTSTTPAKESDKVRYERAVLRVSVEDTSATHLTPDQKMESKKVYVIL